MDLGFIKLHRELLHTGMPLREVALYGFIEATSNKYGYSKSHNGYFASELNCSTRVITSLITKLEKQGYIYIIDPKSFKRKIYLKVKFPCR